MGELIISQKEKLIFFQIVELLINFFFLIKLKLKDKKSIKIFALENVHKEKGLKLKIYYSK